MTLKRNIQHLMRNIRSLKKERRWEPLNVKKVRDSLIAVPSPFDKAIFNFTIDFELIWGNGIVDEKEHSKERRIKAATSQKENFYPFVEMVQKIGIPLTWAIVGKLADSDSLPSENEKFSPSWAQRDWYDSSYKELERSLWDGEEYLNYIEKNLSDHEIKSHGYGHIDYIDKATTEKVAKWDMGYGIAALRKRGHKINGFVYPCNHHGHLHLLEENKIEIIRGKDEQWQTQNKPFHTPLGFWISPTFFTASEVISLIDLAVEKKAFFHPWMHLLECDLKQNDIEDFYYPIFSHVKKLNEQGVLDILSFDEINKHLSVNNS